MHLKFHVFIERPFAKAARKIVLNRLRHREEQWRSRILREDLDPILERAWSNFEELWPEAPRTYNFGNWQATAIAVYTLAFYRSLRHHGIDVGYATELTSDLVWVFHLPWFPWIKLAGYLTGGANPRKRIESGMKGFTKYWGAPGNRYHFPKAKERAFRVNVTQCAMHLFFAQFGKEEMELFSKTHCVLDFTLARVLVKGGWYERPNTLSAGHKSCTMFYYPDSTGRENATGPLPIGSPPRTDIVADAADESVKSARDLGGPDR